MPHPEIVVVERLVKRYGARLAVNGVSFAIREGEIIGLLGPNGSGKSTILRILTGYLPPTSGSVRVDGVDAAEDSLAVRSRVGYVPEDAPLYDWMRVSEFLAFMAEIKGVRDGAARAAVGAACRRLRLEPVMRVPIGKLSRGYRQRVAIAQALVNDPPILILDEPTNALDAYQVIAVRELIRGMAGERTVIVASHVLTEIERVATRVMILRDGELLTADALAEAGGAPRLRLTIEAPPAAVLPVLRNIAGVTAAAVDADAGGAGAYVVEADRPGMGENLARAVVGAGFGLAGLVEEKPDLERIFLDLTRRAVEAMAA